MRLSFDQVFQDNGNGSYTPISIVKIGEATMSPGVTFSSGVSFSGVNIAEYAGRDLEVEEHEDGTIEFKSVY